MAFLSQKVDENMFTGYWKVLLLTFSEMGNTVFSWATTLTEIWYLLITEKFLFWHFRKWEIRSFLEPESWRKYVYWLLESSCFELFGDWKYGLFWVKKLMERWYLLVTEKFLFWTFQWWEIRYFFQPKSWWKDDIYVVFVSFLWYSRTWKIWFFAQWIQNLKCKVLL